MTSLINSPPNRSIWLSAFTRLSGVKNGDYLPLQRLQEATGLESGQKLRDVLATAEREGLLLIDRGATPASYRATYALERQVTLFAPD
ncbi:hypothetical protein F1536_12020 [Achromobacter xylosoxidans]|uniref:hypothetical protein n=1 Tax=Alcaligenes xylosoxydans xylosoxydans TaxID=85698 RepID=UPI0012318548|nr:hypothetical protein [Achromobacter xylosoxidans]KAA5926280.1 hypothetical protein F1536_12020 [Achromobacter xylosoxidans]